MTDLLHEQYLKRYETTVLEAEYDRLTRIWNVHTETCQDTIGLDLNIDEIQQTILFTVSPSSLVSEPNDIKTEPEAFDQEAIKSEPVAHEEEIKTEPVEDPVTGIVQEDNFVFESFRNVQATVSEINSLPNKFTLELNTNIPFNTPLIYISTPDTWDLHPYLNQVLTRINDY